MQRVTATSDLETMALPTIVVVDNLVRERSYSVSFTIPEFTCVCPMTGQPDFATLRITYVPDVHLIELKALKLYINAYRNVGIFHEFVTNKILNDLVAACQPLRMDIEGDFNVRGGIKTVVRAAYERPPAG
ncbi:MAG: NADPH-dependent 7-cyano-7-deazaguanine reductase QueF [Candidatus Tectomicrobia bacterium]|uniref:NADPH-dependent 7-cyano-7-deazaguanine reductase n=1 Tax=Tectimicrobiota bacterium TaxID=2528274 RepID=A0A938B3W3_UNCTE|nr:NADPH-dependent 7-cyano-7-deazaguanine reductase QueF [Candidatus Tectomicrobia bacterium]